MKLFGKLLFLTTIAALFVSCDKSESTLTPKQQKDELTSISQELNSMVDASEFQKAQSIGEYYQSTLSNYGSLSVSLRCGDAMSSVNDFLQALPSLSTKASISTKGLFSANAEFRANDKIHQWEYVGEGKGDGIYFRFTDSEAEECCIKLVTSDTGSGTNRNSLVSLGLYCNNDLVANCSASCVSNGIRDLKADTQVSYGPVANSLVITSKDGQYGVNDILTYDGKKIASCAVTANGVSFSSINDVISAFGNVNVQVDVLDRLQVRVSAESSIPDLFLTNWDKSYVEKLQTYLDDKVDVKVYYTGHDTPQAEITLKVQKTGAPLFGKLEVVPYISFSDEDGSYELSSFIQTESCLPDILEAIESVFGNIHLDL